MQKKTLIEHVKHIINNSDSHYYDNLSAMDKKTYSVFMIHRFLSMNMNWIEVVNEIQKYSTQLKQRGTHKVYDEIIPKGNIFLKYVKPTQEKRYNKEVLEIIKKYFEVGEQTAKEYYHLFMQDKKSKHSLLNIVKLYGIQEDDYIKIEKEILKYDIH